MAKAIEVKIKIPAEFKRLLLIALKDGGWKINRSNIQGISSTEVVITNLVRSYILASLNEIAYYHPQEIDINFEEMEELAETVRELKKQGFITR